MGSQHFSVVDFVKQILAMINIYKIPIHKSRKSTPATLILVLKTVYLVLILFLLSLITTSASIQEFSILLFVCIALILSTMFFTWLILSYYKDKIRRKWFILLFFSSFLLGTYVLLIQLIVWISGDLLSITTKLYILLLSLFIVIGIPTFFYNLNLLFERLRKSKEELEKSKIEMENIKNQINPHFLFNNLNNIYATILFDKDMALDYTRKFSDMMRFYHNMIGKELITLEEELEYIDNYLVIEKYKVGERLTYSISKNVKDVTVQIPPFILSTIIETSIEKGQGLGGHFAIEIIIEMDDNTLNMQVINSIPQQLGKMKKQILIERLDRRLQILYQNRYLLKFEKGPTTETTHLQLPIN